MQQNLVIEHTQYACRAQKGVSDVQNLTRKIPDNSLWNVQEDDNMHGSYHDQQDLIPPSNQNIVNTKPKVERNEKNYKVKMF